MTQRSASSAALLRDGGRPLLALLLVALLLKVVIAAAALGGNPLTRHLISDSRYYVERAAGIAGVLDDPRADEPYHLPPLYPWLLAVVPGAAAGDVTGVLLVQAVAGTALLAGVWLLTRRRASRAAAFAAVMITLAYGPLTFFETKVLGDALAAALLIGWLVACDGLALATSRGNATAAEAARPERPLLRGALVGALIGATSLLRPQALVLAIIGPVWAARRQPRVGLVMALTTALMLVPSVVHNTRTDGGEWTLVSDNGGVNLWLANTGPVSGTFNTYLEDFGSIDGQAAAARRVAEDLAGEPLSYAGVSRTMTGEALAVIASEPATFLRRVGWRMLALVESFETGAVGFFDVERRWIPPLWLLPLPFGVLLGAWLAARVLTLGQRDTSPSALPALPTCAAVLMVVATALVFFHYSRFRLPLVPILAVDLMTRVNRLRHSAAGRPSRGAWFAAVLAGAAAVGVSYAPAPHHDDVLASGWTTMAETRLLDVQPGSLDVLEECLAHAERALTIRPGFARAELLAAQTELMLGRFDACADRTERILQHMPGFPPAVLLRARLLAVPHPDNPHHDMDRAAEQLLGLDMAPGIDAQTRRGISEVRRMLERQQREESR